MKLKTWITGLPLLLAACHASADNKVLLVGMDGVQLETLQQVNSPNMDRLNIRKAYTGGIQGEDSEQVTKSGPGWATILTGVWVNKHKVTSNSSGLASNDFPSIYRRLHDAIPNITMGSFVTWSPIHSQFFSNDLSLIDHKNTGGNDQTNTDLAVNAIKNQNADFVFVHLDKPDTVGHSYCFGSSYNQAVQTADAQLGQLLDAVAEKEASGDNFLVLVTTDHGRTPGSGCNHGNQTESEKTIFIATNKSLNAEYTQTATNLPNTSFNGLYGFTAQTSLVPTILHHMGVTATVDDRLDSTSLLGTPGVRKLMAQQQGISWLPANGDISIFRNGSEADTVNASTGFWQDASPAAGSNDYVFKLGTVPVGYRTQGKLDISAAHGWHNDKIYMFRSDTQYVRYDKSDDKSDSGYPKPVTSGTWPGLQNYKDQISAAFQLDNTTVYFFLDDGRYLSYDIQADRVRSGYPKAVDNDWPGLANYATNIAATLRWKGDRVYFFLKNGQYLRYNLTRGSLDTGYPKPVNNSTWPGLGGYGSKITAAIKWSDSRAYLFLDDNRYIRYSISSDSADAGYPRATNNSSWPGLLN